MLVTERGGRVLNRKIYRLWVLALLVGACSSPNAKVPGNYAPSAVPDISSVGPKTYMEWFRVHAVTDETLAYVENYREAASTAHTSFVELVSVVPEARVTARRNRGRPGEPGVKEPHKVEEKIYRMLSQSRAACSRADGGSREAAFPCDASVLEIRRMVFAAKPSSERALRDIAGLRVITPSLNGVREVVRLVRERFGKRTIRFKDFIGNDYRGDGYRSVHFVILFDGLPVEVQVRTVAQHRWAKWSHKYIYKGRFKHDEAIKRYAVSVSDHLLELDSDDCPAPCEMPDCPAILREAEACCQ